MSEHDDCVANIGPRGRRQRMMSGVVGLVVGVGGAVALVLLDTARPWRLAVFVPFLAGAVGVFQARAKT